LVTWHNHECKPFRLAPPAAKKGDCSVLRLLLRYKTVQQHGDWADQSMSKESISLLSCLQGHSTDIPMMQLQGLAGIVGLTADEVGLLIFQIRTNAASINKGRLGKVGCALSAYMGYTNHDCAPTLQANVDGAGFLVLKATQNIEEGSEGCISYIDEKQGVAARKKALMEQYQFDCNCQRCIAESSKAGSGAKAKGKKKGKKGRR
jgi:hypothetical protein